MQFNCMYVCTLEVANDRHGLTAQPAMIGDFYWTKLENILVIFLH